MAERVLKGKVALVTGAGRGIGREVALMMARHGAKVVVNDYGVSLEGKAEENPGEDVVREIRAAGGEACSNGGSVADWADARAMVQQALDTFGDLHVVVNNAGVLRDIIFHKMTPEDWDAVIRVHLYGAFNTSRAAADHFRGAKHGSLVHMTSTSGLIGNVGQANYMAAKLGIVGLSKAISLDMARYGVRSNCIAPFAWSRMVSSIPDTPEQAERLKNLRAMTPDKVAVLATFLASDAAQEVTGQIFAARMNEIFLMGQSRPLRSVHRSEGWTPETLASHMLPALRGQFYPNEVSADVFTWAPV